MLVLQDHFSKYDVAYVVKDQTAHTAAKTLRNGYFGLFGAPAYLISDQGKAFTGHIITHLCDLYRVQKLRTSPYHAQTNGQVERMNQMIIRMIGKLEEDKKACWSEHLQHLQCHTLRSNQVQSLLSAIWQKVKDTSGLFISYSA